MSSSFIQGCSTTSWRETDKELLQRGRVYRGAAPHTLEGFVDASLLHGAPRERRGERRQRERPVLINLDKRTAGAEEQDRPELRIQAAAQDQLVPF